MLQLVLGLAATTPDHREELVQLYFEKCIFEVCKSGLYPSTATQFVRQHLVTDTPITIFEMGTVLQLLAERSLRTAAEVRNAEARALKAGGVAKAKYLDQANEAAQLKTILMIMGPALEARLAAIVGRGGPVSSNQATGAAVGAAAGAAGGPAGMAIGAVVGFFAGSAADTAQSVISDLTSSFSEKDRILMWNMRIFLAVRGVRGDWV